MSAFNILLIVSFILTTSTGFLCSWIMTKKGRSNNGIKVNYTLCVNYTQSMSSQYSTERFKIQNSLSSFMNYKFNCILNLSLTVKPKFKDRNMKTFVVVKSGNTVRLNINFEVLFHRLLLCSLCENLINAVS